MSLPSAKEKWFARLHHALRDGTFVKLTLSGHRGSDEGLRNVFARRIELQGEPHLSLVHRYATREVTKNFPLVTACALLAPLAGEQFRHAHLFTTQKTLELDCREGRPPRLVESKPVHQSAPSTEHDQARPRLIASDRPWLQALGVTTAEGKVAKGMEAKFRQINKFVEILDSLLPKGPGRQGDPPSSPPTDAPGSESPAASCRLVDMGCGKGYLTFAAYDWLRRHRSADATVSGFEARRELVEFCNRVAAQHHCDGLGFHAGDIATASHDQVDTLVALHACDTATDDAIARGIDAGASLIIVSPCCHKELRPQLVPPPALAGALRHGILRDRHAEFVTDALRAALLEWAGYETKVFEFIATEHTAKNLMISATKRVVPGNRDAAAIRVRELAALYGIRSQQLAASLHFPLAGPKGDPS